MINLPVINFSAGIVAFRFLSLGTSQSPTWHSCLTILMSNVSEYMYEDADQAAKVLPSFLREFKFHLYIHPQILNSFPNH